MNHLRELLEAIPYKVGFDPGWDLQKLRAHFEDVRTVAEKAVCFDIGDIDNLVRMPVIPELCRLPYEVCWFEANFKAAEDSNRQLVAGFLCSESQGAFAADVFLRQPGGLWSLEGAVQAERLQSEYMEVFSDEDMRQGAAIRTMTYGVKAFLSALHCTNVQRQNIQPDAKLQKARAKRGKAPLFSYWTLHLSGEGNRTESQGGVSSSPRVHLRRGHPRQYAKGKWTWVQPHVVGNKHSGVIHKDYSGVSMIASAGEQTPEFDK